MRAGIKVTYLDGSMESATAIVADFIAWERATGRKASTLTDGVGIEDLAILAHAGIKRMDRDTPDFADWLLQVESVEMADDVAPKATKRGASKGS